MERLTKRVYHKEENYSTIEFQNVEPHELGKIKERLCEYEEIGITPEQLRQFADDSWQFQMQNEYMVLRDSSNKVLSCLHKVEKHARDLAKQNAELRAKLAEYENAEEQSEFKTAYDENHVPYMVEATGSEAKHIIELLTMEAQGLLLALPVKIGQDIYVLKKAWWEDNLKKTKIVKENFTLAFFCDPFNEWKFGEDYFLTEAEALQALKEREKDG